MTAEETREEAAREREERKIFRAVFGDGRGKSVLTWILNECRYFSQDSAIIDPLLMGFCNRLLGKIGVNHAAILTGLQTTEETGMKTVLAIDAIDLQWFAEGEPPVPPPAEPPANPETPPAGDPPGQNADPDEEWKGWWGAQLTKETREKHKDSLLEFKGKQLGEVFDDYFGSRERYKNAVIFPGADAKPDEIEAFLKRMDIPKTADEYGFDPKQIPIQGTDERKAEAAKEVVRFAKNTGLTRGQGAKLYGLYQSILKNAESAGAEKRKSLADTFEERLLQDAGNEKTAGETKEYFERALVALGDKQLVKELGESGMLYSTAFARGIADIWKTGNREPPVVQGPPGGNETAKDALPKGDEFNKHYGSRRK